MAVSPRVWSMRLDRRGSFRFGYELTVNKKPPSRKGKGAGDGLRMMRGQRLGGLFMPVACFQSLSEEPSGDDVCLTGHSGSGCAPFFRRLFPVIRGHGTPPEVGCPVACLQCLPKNRAGRFRSFRSLILGIGFVIFSPGGVLRPAAWGLAALRWKRGVSIPPSGVGPVRFPSARKKQGKHPLRGGKGEIKIIFRAWPRP